MADYLTPTVVQQNIPDKDISPIERLLLESIFSVERHGEDLYFFCEEGPSTFATFQRAQLEAALAASPDRPSSLAAKISSQIAEAPAHETEIEIDLSVLPYETIFQDILRRSETLSYVSILSAFTCTRMRPDGFGGMAVLVTKDAILGKSTTDILEDFLVEAGLDEREDETQPRKDDRHD